MTYQDRKDRWLKEVRDDRLLKELMNMTEAEASDAFYRELEFGTAGLRGTMGPGTNRMNIYTVSRAARALAAVLGDNSSVAISYDTRNNSRLFAEVSATALAELGVKVYMFPEAMPLPLLSYAIPKLECQAGIMLTASHNPPQYNGFKCFGSDGGQIQGELADKISDTIENTPLFYESKKQFSDYVQLGQIQYIERKLVDNYMSRLMECCILPHKIKKSGLKVLYTPLNGTGAALVPEALKNLGVELYTVDSQMAADGNFTTCPKPNPEASLAFAEAYKLADSVKPDIILATDPDCDRIGLSIPTDNGFVLFTGNETGCLLLDYITSARAAAGTLPENAVVIKSIVSSPLADAIAESRGCTVVNVPVGFKYIGEKMTELKENGNEGNFVLGFEESCGYNAGMHCRDKDGVCAAVMLCEMAADMKLKGIDPLERLEELYKEFGYYVNTVQSVELPGENGEALREEIMRNLRQNSISSILCKPIISFTDYLTCTRKTIDGKTETVALPPLDVLEFQIEGAKVIARPSGTEPKIKVYYTAAAQSKEKAQAAAQALQKEMQSFLAV